MMRYSASVLVFSLVIWSIISCTPTRLPLVETGAVPVPSSSASSTLPTLVEIDIQPLPLTGLASLPSAEFSGLAWYKDWLILLPQYPSRFPGGGEGALLAISKQEIIDFLDGKTSSALSPRSVPLLAPGLTSQVRGYEGFEAIAINGERIYLAMETNSGSGMVTYLVGGLIASDLASIKLNTGFLRPIQAQASISNFSDEAIILAGDAIFSLYEANGVEFNPHPIAHQFDLNLTSPAVIPFPNIEYRITDATPLDSNGNFWAINYFFPGDTKIAPLHDPLVGLFGEGRTHAAYLQVERLVQFHYQDGEFNLSDRPPIQLALMDAATARNWEGLAVLEGRGFLLVTDQYPGTILAFIPYSQ